MGRFSSNGSATRDTDAAGANSADLAMVMERDGAWLGTLRKVLSKLGLSAPESKETLAADLDAQMLRVQRAVENHFVAQAEASDEGQAENIFRPA